MRKLALFVICLILIFVRVPPAAALDLSRFERLVVFGDSLSDNGNLFAITKGGKSSGASFWRLWRYVRWNKQVFPRLLGWFSSNNERASSCSRIYL
jgi:phospholipase/lecithinase/hemolysin